MDDIVRAHIRVSGRVQGVFFRQTTAREAEHIGGVTGWVKNLSDGDVEAVIEGRRQQVEQLVAWCHHGPPASRVDNVSVTWEEPTGEFARFSIEY